MKKAGKNRRSHTLYTKIKGQKIISFAVVVSLLMIIYIPMASASTTIIIATKHLPSNTVFSAANDWRVPLGENFESYRLPVLSDWLKGTGINDADVKKCFIDKNIKNDELEVMMILDLEDKRLTLSSLSVDTNCSFLDIINYRFLQGFNDSLGSIVNTTRNNRKTLDDFNDSLGSFEKETRRTLEIFNDSLGSFKEDTGKTLENFQETSKDLKKTSEDFCSSAKILESQQNTTQTLLILVLATLISGIIGLLFFVVGKRDTKRRR